MRRFLHLFCFGLALSLAVREGAGFSLLGPNPTWQTTAIGYVDFTNLPNDVNGGPMNLGEGYRWSVPTIFYSYSPDFLHYFGERGAQEIDKAIAMLNALPSMNSVNVDSFPLQTERINFQARALAMYDLKSVALSFIVHDLGLTDPTRYVFTLRNRFTDITTNYYVIQRNFDPVTFEPTAFINGQLWTYYNILDPVPGTSSSLVVPEPVDPLALGGLINAPVTSALANTMLRLGGFWTGLTRDDVGGLRYLYRESNLNVETAPPNASLFIPGTTSAISSTGEPATSPWSIPDFPGAGTGTGTGTGVVTPTANSTNIVNTALRPGVGKVSFVRINYDGFFGSFPSNNVSYVDRVITNGVIQKQSVVRPLLAPDLVFDAQDLQLGDTANFVTRELSALTFLNNDAINGLTGPTDGPGQIHPTGTATSVAIITFSKVGSILLNNQPAFLSEVNSSPVWRWGTFDGSTNAPFAYPSGTSISALEQQALNGHVTGGAGGVVSLVSPWTSVDSIIFPPGTAIGGGTGTGGGTGVGTGTTP